MEPPQNISSGVRVHSACFCIRLHWLKLNQRRNRKRNKLTPSSLAFAERNSLPVYLHSYAQFLVLKCHKHSHSIVTLRSTSLAVITNDETLQTRKLALRKTRRHELQTAIGAVMKLRVPKDLGAASARPTTASRCLNYSQCLVVLRCGQL